MSTADSKALEFATVGDCRGDCTGDSTVGLVEIMTGGSRGVDASACLSIGSELAGRLISMGDEESGSSEGLEVFLKAVKECWLSAWSKPAKNESVMEEDRLDCARDGV